MSALRRACRVLARVGTGRSYQFVLLLAGSMAVVAFYYFGSEKHNFSSTTKRIKQTRASHNSNRNDADLTADWETHPGEEDNEAGAEKRHYHLLMMFTKVDKSRSLQDKFRVAMLSMVKHARFLEGEKLLLHFVSDQASRELAEKMLQEFLTDATFKYEVVFHDVGALTRSLAPIVEAMQKHFSAGSGAYYSDAIFFLSVAMHRIMPEALTHMVQLDLDLKYRTNIRDLFQEFDHFAAGAVIGIAREMQPVYSMLTGRHTFWQYRKENPGTPVGEPPPEGQPGFNSGVMLLHLAAMRASPLYNQLLQPHHVGRLAQHYHFRGHLGDQDFFTMVGMEHPHLFYSLPCGWNRQLCTWWREHGYAEVFPLYYRCDTPVFIYHGNCNSVIPHD
ncbi:xyloside xylosyltransferase 1 isoform X1 [Nerophis lumbriciformis]|uniref:xyloside xylosyltransferase 1 isoform X1 n=1 Tax=Nerophis lumbriciformis TaxID=546530 RepID=UPI002ADFE891|nr:xyloside xylosyltransferase 1-like isoform X1 [Nerophis lumbriciformis]